MKVVVDMSLSDMDFIEEEFEVYIRLTEAEIKKVEKFINDNYETIPFEEVDRIMREDVIDLLELDKEKFFEREGRW